MFDYLLQLVILFFVIFDPPLSLVVFVSGTSGMTPAERNKTAIFAVAVAALLSFVFLLFGDDVLNLFNTNIMDFKVAGGVMLFILGVMMVLGKSISSEESMKGKSSQAIASLIATPLLTGPAAIATIIITSQQYGVPEIAIAISIVLGIALAMFFVSGYVMKYLGTTSLRVVSTIMGLITLAWGIAFIKGGLGF
jgi:multiple antibiotic resistance protein